MPISIFKKLANIFKQTGVTAVLIGGYAVNAHKVTRHTVDIDFLIFRDDFDKVFKELEPVGYAIAHQQDAFVQLTGKGLRDIDFMLSDAETAYAMYNTGDRITIAGELFVTPSLGNLIALKLHSIRWNPHRELVDLPDIILLLQANDVDIESAEIKVLFEKYGTPELYQKAQKSFRS
ncbi:MAG: hypothetical protein GF344_04735 [Chitinivibrionales bacterium]|nr:hypothetical protein [Chitinivibrionales bacterium]